MSAVARRGRRAVRESQEERLVRSIIREMLMPAPRVQYLALHVEGFPLGGDWVRDVLGYRIPLNEGPVDEALVRRLVREGIEVSQWFAKAKDAIGMGIDSLKKKASDASEAIDEFGESVRGASAALWVAAVNGDFGVIVENTRKVMHALADPVIKVIQEIKDLIDLVKGDSSYGDFDIQLDGAPSKEEIEKKPLQWVIAISKFLKKLLDKAGEYTGVAAFSAGAACTLIFRWIREEVLDKVKNAYNSAKSAVEKLGKKATTAAVGAAISGVIVWFVSDTFKNLVKSVVKEFFTSTIVQSFIGPAKFIKDLVKKFGQAAWAVETVSHCIIGKTGEA